MLAPMSTSIVSLSSPIPTSHTSMNQSSSIIPTSHTSSIPISHTSMNQSPAITSTSHTSTSIPISHTSMNQSPAITSTSSQILTSTSSQTQAATSQSLTTSRTLTPPQNQTPIKITQVKIKPPPPYEVDIPSVILNTVKKIKSLAEIIKQDPQSYELESRLIRKIPRIQKITSNVQESLYKQIQEFYIRNARHFKFTPEFYTLDKFFPGDIRVRQKWSLKNKKVTVQWIRKKLIENSDWNVDGRPLGIRFSLKSEKEIEPLKTLPLPNWIQLKETCSFERNGQVIYFSTVWEGESEYKMRVSLCQRTIEVEPINSEVVALSADDIARNLIIASLELQGLNGPLSLTYMNDLC